MSAKIFLGCIFAFYIVVIVIAFIKSKRFFTVFLLTALQGVSALFAVNLIGQYIMIHIPVNAWSLGVSSVGGVSGVIMMVLCDTFI